MENQQYVTFHILLSLLVTMLLFIPLAYATEEHVVSINHDEPAVVVPDTVTGVVGDTITWVVSMALGYPPDNPPADEVEVIFPANNPWGNPNGIQLIFLPPYGEYKTPGPTNKAGTFKYTVNVWKGGNIVWTADPYVVLTGGGVGGIVVSVDTFALLAPYIGFALTTIFAVVVVVVYVKRSKHEQ